MEKLNNLVQAAAEFHTRMRTEGELALKEAFAEFFNIHPEVGAIVWEQYTPYFNDGDACTFSRHEFEFLSPDDAQDRDCDTYEVCLKNQLNTIEYARKYPRSGSPGRALTGVEQTHLDTYNAFERTCGQVNDLFKTVFGDHVKVRATREGFEVDEYDHD